MPGGTSPRRSSTSASGPTTPSASASAFRCASSTATRARSRARRARSAARRRCATRRPPRRWPRSTPPTRRCGSSASASGCCGIPICRRRSARGRRWSSPTGAAASACWISSTRNERIARPRSSTCERWATTGPPCISWRPPWAARWRIRNGPAPPRPRARRRRHRGVLGILRARRAGAEDLGGGAGRPRVGAEGRLARVPLARERAGDDRQGAVQRGGAGARARTAHRPRAGGLRRPRRDGGACRAPVRAGQRRSRRRQGGLRQSRGRRRARAGRAATSARAAGGEGRRAEGTARSRQRRAQGAGRARARRLAPADARRGRRPPAGRRRARRYRHHHGGAGGAGRRRRRAQRGARPGRRLRPVRRAGEPVRHRRPLDDVGGGRRLRARRAPPAPRPGHAGHAALLPRPALRRQRRLHQRRSGQGDADGEGACGGGQSRPKPQGRDVRQRARDDRHRARAHAAPGGHPPGGRRHLRAAGHRVRHAAAPRGQAGRRDGRPRRGGERRHAGRQGREQGQHHVEEPEPVTTRLIAFALHQRFITLALALLLTAGGIVSYYRLPIEAYPDVGDVKAEVITLWPGHAAEEVERLITIPLENELNGIANVTVLRSDTLFGLSNIKVIFADGTDDYWARAQAQERIAQADLPSDAKPALGPLSSVIGEIYRYTLESKTVSLVELKALQTWVLEREFRKIPGVADVVSWGGGTKQYQVMLDPNRLRAYNVTLKQVFDAVAANNANAGGSYIAQGQYPGRVIEAVKTRFPEIEKLLPAGVTIRPYYSRDVLVKRTVTTVLRNLVEGAVDFGIIVDGAVIMTENIMRRLAERKPTGPRVVGEVQHAAVEVARPLTFAVLIIMTVYVPILTFERIEGKLFR